MENFIIKIKLLFLFIILIIIYIKRLFENKKHFIQNISYKINTFFFNGRNKSSYITFNLSHLEYSFSMKFGIAEVKFNICFYDENNTLINPSDLSHNYNFHIFCYIKDNYTNISIYSFAGIYNNKYYCIEFFQTTKNVILGIKLYQPQNFNLTIQFFSNNIINYHDLKFINDNIFNSSFILNNYKEIENKIAYNNLSKNEENFLLKRSYMNTPICKPKLNLTIDNNIWFFQNIYNHYFCFCKGANCIYNNNNYQRCKYNFYLSIIDNNRYSYNKTDYLLADFRSKELSAHDTYPIFKEMIKQNISAHYMTEKKDIYRQYCGQNYICKIIINDTHINGDFLENYLLLLLKLKVVISGSGYSTMDNLFYNIEYITFLYVGHGVNYFKPFLYKDYMGCQSYNKIVTTPSNKIISLVLKYGWKEENIIKLCLPRWDYYDIYKNQISLNNNNKYIFIFFTWRKLRNSKLSPDYFKNILNIINNETLYPELIKNNIILYYNFHYMLYEGKSVIKTQKKNIILINNDQISDCIAKSSLLVSDFSSILFDFIYQRKPTIMYIPDVYDDNIKYYYDDNYFNIINNIRNGSIYFENKFFKVEDVIDKIIYYINNNFMLENKIQKFYDSFELNCGRNITQMFINYILKLK